MSKYKVVEDLIGNTPLIELVNFEKKNRLDATLLAKLESFNPGGSVKDRIALSMIEDAEKRGILKPGAVIIEPTSGNTGIGIAAVAAIKGYKAIFTMPETMSAERIALLKAYGAEVVLTPGSEGMAGAVKEAERLAKETPDSFIPGQFENPANPRIHYETTGPEIWKQTDGNIDFFVAGVGTGGTLSGVGKYLKKKDPNIKIIAVEPASSPLLTKGKAGPHGIQGIGANFIPKTLDTGIYDEVIDVTDENALETGKEFSRIEGFLCGISGGAALWASLQIAKRPENKGKVIVVLLPDGGDRYLSTKLFQ
ncbi:MAG: cysteine synthase A [Burkholderiales bacterium]|nr:cysteine synthase A [Burkholderiales bacterium]